MAIALAIAVLLGCASPGPGAVASAPEFAINPVYAQTAVVHDSWFGPDKIKHFFMSGFIESVTYSALQAARVNHRAALGGAIGVTMAVGVSREIHDQRTPGNIFSLRDLTWDAVGATAGAVLLSQTRR